MAYATAQCSTPRGTPFVLVRAVRSHSPAQVPNTATAMQRNQDHPHTALQFGPNIPN